MGDVNAFEDVCRAMSDPAFYPHPVTGPERRDTHISVVFLTGEWVYKLKKPLDFGFLDYKGIETRRTMCEREVALNQRLSSGIYEGVVAIRKSLSGYRINGAGEVAEYAVKMRQLPDEASLANLIPSGGVDREQMLLLGRHLGRFYSTSGRGSEIDRYGRADTISYNTEENFRQLAPYVGKLIRKEPFEFIREVSRGFFRDSRPLFERRIEEGRIYDGHGDLRAEHVYFVDRVQVIDCIEFNERFRYGDSAVDLAFLHMDVERLGRPDLSLAALTGYIQASGDFGIYSLLDFYSCYRAIVKMKVSCLTWSELEENARRREMESRAGQYLDMALRYAVQFSRPAIWVFCGLPGSGKSTLAEKVSDTFGIPLFQSDRARRDLPEYRSHPGGPVPLGTGIYRPELRGRVYAHLLGMAHDEVKKGRSVVLDATFSQRKWREEAVRMAEDLDVNILFFECVSSERSILERLGRRRSGDGGLSDARIEHVPGLAEQFEKTDELQPELHARIDTESKGAEQNLAHLLAMAYEMRRKQVERALKRL